MNDPGDNTMPRTFGPMTPQAPQTPQANISEDRIVARILAALQQGQAPQATPAVAAPVSLSPEDQRLVSALASVHPSGKNVIILSRDQLGTNLFFVEYAFTNASGARQNISALVYDNGEKTKVFGGH